MSLSCRKFKFIYFPSSSYTVVLDIHNQIDFDDSIRFSTPLYISLLRRFLFPKGWWGVVLKIIKIPTHPMENRNPFFWGGGCFWSYIAHLHRKSFYPRKSKLPQINFHNSTRREWGLIIMNCWADSTTTPQETCFRHNISTNVKIYFSKQLLTEAR